MFPVILRGRVPFVRMCLEAALHTHRQGSFPCPGRGIRSRVRPDASTVRRDIPPPS
ncbi:hypothetical protein DESPIG_00509 [Desulfovibrio piger ATCC 29098]|uniref:Uncharacterized protein n=1 Tax=Desulfovibrio piger ATCC 29098 TaxID=411464 RepID=B6WR29_9BACT|nr:hypothetical protein DESPIG_00509 [Desulfovibrio piger ATCC 29098]